MKEKTPLSDLLPAESCPCSGMRGTMAFCKNCGTELKEGAAFCKNCGFRVGDKLPAGGAGKGTAPGASGFSGGDYQRILKEKMDEASARARDLSSDLSASAGKAGKGLAQKCREDKRYRMGLGAAAVLFIALIAVLLVTEQMGKRIPLDECILVEVSGYDSAGTAVAYLDDEAFEKAAVKAMGGETDMAAGSDRWFRQLDELNIYGLKNLVSLNLENSTELSNGDEVVVTFTFDQDAAKEQGVKFVGKDYTYTVENLPLVTELDPFAELLVLFEGVAPDVYLTYEYQGLDGVLSTYSFRPDKDYGFTAGESVTISVDISEEEALQYGYRITNQSKEYVCENVDTYLGSAEQLSEEALGIMQRDASDCIESYFANYFEYISCGDIRYEGCYVLGAKEEQRRSDSVVYLISSAEVSSREVYDYSNESRGIVEGSPVFTPRRVYFPIAFSNVICKADGSVEYNRNNNIAGSTELSFNGWSSVKGYTNERKMYNELAGSYKADYNIEILGEFSETAEVESADAGEDGQYILPGSSSQYLSLADLEGLTKEECRIARNEIYARYGRKFDDEQLQAYFDEKDWYTGTIEASDFSDDYLNDFEKVNRDLIVEYETRMGYR